MTIHQVVLKMLGAEHLLVPPEERSASWRNSDYTEVYRLTMVMVVVVMSPLLLRFWLLRVPRLP